MSRNSDSDDDRRGATESSGGEVVVDWHDCNDVCGDV